MSEDYLYFSNEKLQNFIQSAKNQDEGVLEYLKNVKYAPISDFPSGLEWFNVTEPLSFTKHLKGKVVVLDFFTYCCINCLHVLPDLKEIEDTFSVEEGLVVVGVHSAKFENEKISSNVLAAVQRNNISHPVVNDSGSEMWKNCDVHCWPTLLLLGPNSNPIVMLTGEGHKNDLILYIRNAIKFYKEQGLISDHKLPIRSAYHLLPDMKGPLLFPGKIANVLDVNNNCEILAVSDTGNNRILIVKSDGGILQQIGGKRVGFKDGSIEDAEFNNPQGLVFQNRDILYVADTENHAIRKVDLKNKTVVTVAGTGKQGEDHVGGKIGTNQAISSPWDICIFRTPDMDLTFHPDGNPPIRDILIIAMAGTHQIWALFLEDTVWWKCKKHPAGTCINIAGSGREENRNNLYPHAAAFAQPSGLALCQKNKEIFIADSESSSVRKLSLVDGKVTPVVGGDRNPQNLFAFGDKDGCLYDAKLQHLLGLAPAGDEKTLFVADTYNHKLKKINLSENSIVSLTLPAGDCPDGASTGFREPSGICVSVDNKKLYVTDTNNHQIKVVHLNSKQSIVKIEKLDLKMSNEDNNVDESKYDVLMQKPVNINENGGKVILTIKLAFENGLGLTEGAPQHWMVNLRDVTWSAVPKSGSDLNKIETVISISKSSASEANNLDFLLNLVTCTADSCLPRNLIVRIPVKFKKNGDIKISEKIDLILRPEGVQRI
ncbi:unnamed protein product [Phyllotreta striolata]|uniref:Thioredoxin domain-containing protein n=1 Tax=Phyllotreta striolata TaxID=444603 RepID=A0A9N9XRX2_PHYSR|nr:unnamed protein product [Phyllotreta striolata]